MIGRSVLGPSVLRGFQKRLLWRVRVRAAPFVEEEGAYHDVHAW